MNSPSLPDLWTTFTPEMRRQLTHLWSELLYRQLQAQRLHPTGGPHEHLSFPNNSSGTDCRRQA